MTNQSPRWMFALLSRALLYAIGGLFVAALCGGLAGSIVGAFISLEMGPFPDPSYNKPPRSLADALPGLVFGGLTGAFYGSPLGFLAFLVGGFLSDPHEKGAFYSHQMFRSLAIGMGAGMLLGGLGGGLASASLGAAFAFFQGADLLDVATSFTVAGAPILMIVGGTVGAVWGAKRGKTNRLK